MLFLKITIFPGGNTKLNFDLNENASRQAEELKGTTLGSSSSSPQSSELDSLIAETLNESKVFAPSLSQKEKASFSATPMPKIEAKVPAETNKVQQMPQISQATVPSPQKAETPAPKENTQDQYDMTFKTFNVGEVVKGKIAKIDSTGALVDIKYKSDGFINAGELLNKKLAVGDEVDVFIVSLSSKEGHVELSLKEAEVELSWKALYDSYKFKNALDVKVTSAVGGGLVIDYNGIRGFVPASHVSKSSETQLAEFVGKVIPVKVIEIDRRHGKIIMSHRFGSVEKQKVDREKYFDQIEVGSVLHGRVSSIKKFGVFVNVNGIEGLVHINEMSWKRVNDPSKLVSMGQEIDVFVIGVDKASKKVSFGLKQLQPDPWASIADKYNPGQIINVKILRIAKFGAFAELEEGIEGLIHNSEISSKNFQNASEVIKPGDIVKVKILRVIPEEQKIGLSIREIETQEQKQELKEVQESMPPQKITIGDTVGDSIKEHFSNQSNELSEPA